MKKHLLFLFMSQGNASPGTTLDWKPDHLCDEKYNTSFYREGYFVMLEKLLDEGCFDELTIIYESNRGHGIANWVDHPKATCLVVPEIAHAEQFITDKTIIFVRGGFKHWHDWLLKYKGKNWLLLYAANTGRQRWLWWDIIFDDILMRHEIDKNGRYLFPFIKPIDDEFYVPDEYANQTFDVCIGASHIHDKKGQWRMVKVAEEYKRLFKRKLNCVMPGSPRRGIKTIRMLEDIRCDPFDYFNIAMTGHIHKENLVKIYQQSKIFMHLGSHGQNDRGPLEASSCGCLVGLGSPAYHTKLLRNPSLSFSPIELDNYELIACLLKDLLESNIEDGRIERSTIFRKRMGFFFSWFRMMALINLLWDEKPDFKSKQRIKNNISQIIN